MEIQNTRLLPQELNLVCYVCEAETAVFLCKFNVDDLAVQVCLCPNCMKLDTSEVIRNTIGIQEHTPVRASSYLSG